MHSSTLYEAQQIPEMSRFAAWAKKQQEDQAEGLVLAGLPRGRALRLAKPSIPQAKAKAGIPIESLPKRQLEPFLVDNSDLSDSSSYHPERALAGSEPEVQASSSRTAPGCDIAALEISWTRTRQ